MGGMATVAQQKVILNTGESQKFIPFGYVVDQKGYRKDPVITVTAPETVETPTITSNYSVTHKFLPDGTVLATVKLQISGEQVVDGYEVRVSEIAG